MSPGRDLLVKASFCHVPSDGVSFWARAGVLSDNPQVKGDGPQRPETSVAVRFAVMDGVSAADDDG